jgi:PhzF family phenazine biosynthesis protein
MRIPLFHVDAFADQPFRGNPAAVCLLNSWLDDASLLKVAAENNLSATAFLVRQTDRNELRWFTPICEIKLCGHATMAAAYVVFEVLNFELQTVAFETRFRGALTVNKNGDRLAMNLPLFVPEPCRDIPADLTKALGERMSPSEVLAVNDTFIAIFGDSRIIQSYEPNFDLLEKLHPHAVCISAPGQDSDFVSRYFAPGYGVPEDSVTGSVHSALAPYWTKRLNKTRLHARQLSTRGGDLWCEVSGDRVNIEGQAALIMRGSLTF